MQESYEFFYALCDKTEKARQAVIDSCKNIDAQDEVDGWTALMWAAAQGKKDVAETLIKNKANLDLQERYGDTALMLAIINGHIEIVKLLVANKASLDAQDKNGLTALMWAAVQGEKDVAEILIKNKAKLNLQNQDGQSALMLAASKGYTEIVKMLVANKANLDTQDTEGRTALMWAVAQGKKDVAETLIKNKAKLNLQNQRGETALMLAVFAEEEEIVKMLVENGANLYLTDGWHANVFSHASPFPKILEILNKAEAKLDLQTKDAKKATKLVVHGKETPKKSKTQAKSENQKKSKSDIQITITNVPNGKEKPTVLNCGTITEAQKQDFLAAISEHKPSDGDNHTCGFNVYHAKQSAMRVVPYEVSTNFQPTKQKIGKNELIVEMIPMSKKECGSWANYHCPICLASGDCTSPLVKRTVGALLFPDKYGKQR